MELEDDFKEQITIKRHQEILKALAKTIDTTPLEKLIEKNIIYNKIQRDDDEILTVIKIFLCQK